VWHKNKYLLFSVTNNYLESIIRALVLALSVIWMYLCASLTWAIFVRVSRCLFGNSLLAGKRNNLIQFPWRELCTIFLRNMFVCYVMNFGLKLFNVSVPLKHFVIFIASVALLGLAVDAVLELLNA
jgi:hypothetical protein